MMHDRYCYERCYSTNKVSFLILAEMIKLYEEMLSQFLQKEPDEDNTCIG